MHLLFAFFVSFLSSFVVSQDFLLNPSNLSSDSVTAYSFNFQFDRVEGASAYLSVLSDSNGFSFPVRHKTYRIGDTVGNARVIGVGLDTIISPRGIRANHTYYLTVFSSLGSIGLEEYSKNKLSILQVDTKGLDAKEYYEGINVKAPNFIGALTELLSNHQVINYSDYKKTVLNKIEIRDTFEGNSYVECVYSGERKVFLGEFDWTKIGYSREHTFAHSWMPSYPANNPYKDEYSDLFNLYPTNLEKANSVRSNHPFGEVTGKIIDSYLDGKLGYNGSEIVYEPKETH